MLQFKRPKQDLKRQKTKQLTYPVDLNDEHFTEETHDIVPTILFGKVSD